VQRRAQGGALSVEDELEVHLHLSLQRHGRGEVDRLHADDGVPARRRGARAYTRAASYDQYEGAWDTNVVVNVLGEVRHRSLSRRLRRRTALT
jgi:hypothetical protein